MKFLRKLFLVFAVVYLLPALASAGLWYLKERPQSWHDADWSSSGILADAAASPQAAIYVFSATTGGMKGAVASHAWIVTKDEGASTYNRYEKVGWASRSAGTLIRPTDAGIRTSRASSWQSGARKPSA